MANQVKFEVFVHDAATQKLNAIQAKFSALQARLSAPFKAAGLANVTRSLGTLRSAMQAVPIAGTLFAAGGLAAVTGALIKNSIAATDALGKISDLTQAYKIGAKELQVYSKIGADFDIESESIAKAFGFLNKQISDARNGGKNAIELFASVGVNKNDLKKDAATLFSEISEVYKKSNKSSDDALKIDAAKALFGKSGIDLIPLLEQGGEVYKQTLEKMTKQGLIFSETEISTYDAVSDKFNQAAARAKALKMRIGLEMSPVLDAITKSINNLMDSPAKGEMLNIFKDLGMKLADSLPVLIKKIPELTKKIGQFFSKLSQIGSFIGWDKIILGGFIMLSSPFIASTISLTMALGGLALNLAKFSFGLAMPMLMNMANFGASLVKHTMLAYSLGGASQALATTFGVLRLSLAAAAGAAWAFSAALLANPITWIAAAIVAAGLLIYKYWQPIKAFMGGVWDGIKPAFEPLMPIFNAIATALSPIGELFKMAFGFVGEMIGGVIGWFSTLFTQTQYGANELKGFADSGRSFGLILGSVFTGLLTPVYLFIDALKLVKSTYDWAIGNTKGFEFNSTTADAFKTNNSKFSAQSQAQISTQKTTVGGTMDIRIRSDGSAIVEGVGSTSPNFKVTAVNKGKML